MKHKDPLQAFFGDDTAFSGTLSFEGAVKIDGKFEGEIRTEEGGELVVGPTAVVKAEVHVGVLTVQGKMEGNVTVSKKLNISSEGQVIGNVTAPALFIEDWRSARRVGLHDHTGREAGRHPERCDGPKRVNRRTWGW